jgi:DNA-binding response OmpR family regulator
MKVLVVDDDPELLPLVAFALRQSGFSAVEAGSGEQGLLVLEAERPDLLILDLNLPGINGLEVCRRLRVEGIASPILMLTARGDPGQRVEGLDAGADDYLAKPYHFPELLARVRALLRRGPALAPSVLSVHDLTVDTRARRVERAGHALALTTKEYALLEYLLRRQGEVVGRASIAEHVWDDTFDPMSNLIEVYIQRLRRKLDDGHQVKLIHTRRGAGYSLGIADDAAVHD